MKVWKELFCGEDVKVKSGRKPMSGMVEPVADAPRQRRRSPSESSGIKRTLRRDRRRGAATSPRTSMQSNGGCDSRSSSVGMSFGTDSHRKHSRVICRRMAST